MKKRTVSLMCIVLAFVALFSGCGFMAPGELLAMPEQPAEYATLQSAINQVLTAGAEYSSPVSGNRRQSVQMVDLDSDGDEEAIAFFKTLDEKPLKMCIFARHEEKWVIMGEITGEGSAFDSVDIVRLGQDGTLYLVVGWQIGGDFTCAMSVYSLKDLKPVEIGSFSYDEYKIFDVDTDSASEILAVTASTGESTGEVKMYKLNGTRVEEFSRAGLSGGAGTVKVVKTGYLKDYTPALFVMSTYEYGFITDIIGTVEGELKNLVLNPITNRASTYVTKYYYSRDINNDMITELPIPRQLKSSETLIASANRYILQWYSLDSSGRRQLTMTTYQNDNDGWYIDLTGIDYELVVNMSESGSGESAAYFYKMNEKGELTEVFSVFTLSGDNRYSRATVGRRFMIMENGDKVYAARLPQNDDLQQLEADRDELKNRFHLLAYDWDTGEVS